MPLRAGTHKAGGDYRPTVESSFVIECPSVNESSRAHALLGAAGLPDLGSLFPATDDAYRDASSVVLLREVVERVSGAGWKVANVDVVVAAEMPRLGPHVAAMSTTLGEVVIGPVSVKPKRTEGVGAVGRGEGIAAWAVALLVGEDGPRE